MDVYHHLGGARINRKRQYDLPIMHIPYGLMRMKRMLLPIIVRRRIVTELHNPCVLEDRLAIDVLGDDVYGYLMGIIVIFKPRSPTDADVPIATLCTCNERDCQYQCVHYPQHSVLVHIHL